MSHEKYQFRDTLKENAGLSVYNTGYEQCESGQIWGPALRDHYLIHYVVSGSGILHCNGQDYPVGAGMVFIIFPSQVASYQADTDNPWQYNWVGFNGADARRLVKMTGLSKDQPVWQSDDPEETSTLLRNIADVSDNTAAADAEMVGRLYLFLAHLIKLNRNPPNLRRQRPAVHPVQLRQRHRRGGHCPLRGYQPQPAIPRVFAGFRRVAPRLSADLPHQRGL